MVFIVDDDTEVRETLLRILSLAGYAAEGFSSNAWRCGSALLTIPCCLILDMKTPTANTFDLVRMLQEKGHAIPIIFISKHGTIPLTVQAMKAGAHEFFIKPIRCGQLLNAVEDALCIAETNLASRNERVVLTQRFGKLTPREHDVLKLAIGGLRNKQIANELGISEITAKVHKRRVMDKMQTRTLADLVRAAERLQIPHSIN